MAITLGTTPERVDIDYQQHFVNFCAQKQQINYKEIKSKMEKGNKARLIIISKEKQTTRKAWKNIQGNKQGKNKLRGKGIADAAL